MSVIPTLHGRTLTAIVNWVRTHLINVEFSVVLVMLMACDNGIVDLQCLRAVTDAATVCPMPSVLTL